MSKGAFLAVYTWLFVGKFVKRAVEMPAFKVPGMVTGLFSIWHNLGTKSEKAMVNRNVMCFPLVLFFSQISPEQSIGCEKRRRATNKMSVNEVVWYHSAEALIP